MTPAPPGTTSPATARSPGATATPSSWPSRRWTSGSTCPGRMWWPPGSPAQRRRRRVRRRSPRCRSARTSSAPAGSCPCGSPKTAQAGAGTARVLTYHYLSNPGGIGSPASAPMTVPPGLRRAPALAAAVSVLPAAVTTGGHLTAPAAVAGPQIIGGPAMAPGDSRALFTSSNTSATIKGKLSEYSTPPGTVQFFDQSGTAGAQASATSLPVTAAAANTYTGCLGVANFAANWSVTGTGQSWTTPSGWTSDGSVNNLALNFSIYYQAGITAGPASVTGTIGPGTGGTMAAWAAGLATTTPSPR